MYLLFISFLPTHGQLNYYNVNITKGLPPASYGLLNKLLGLAKEGFVKLLSLKNSFYIVFSNFKIWLI